MQNTENNSRCKKNPRQNENFFRNKVRNENSARGPRDPAQVWYVPTLCFVVESQSPLAEPAFVSWNSDVDWWGRRREVVLGGVGRKVARHRRQRRAVKPCDPNSAAYSLPPRSRHAYFPAVRAVPPPTASAAPASSPPKPAAGYPCGSPSASAASLHHSVTNPSPMPRSAALPSSRIVLICAFCSSVRFKVASSSGVSALIAPVPADAASSMRRRRTTTLLRSRRVHKSEAQSQATKHRHYPDRFHDTPFRNRVAHRTPARNPTAPRPFTHRCQPQRNQPYRCPLHPGPANPKNWPKTPKNSAPAGRELSYPSEVIARPRHLLPDSSIMYKPS